MKHLKLSIAFIALVLAVLISGCYPDKIQYVDEYDMAGTMYDHAADFSSYTTFHVLDTVMHITEDGEDDPNSSQNEADESEGKVSPSKPDTSEEK